MTVPALLALATIGLVRVLWSALAASVVVAAAFSAAILFFVRCSDMRLERRRGPALAFAALGAGALAVFAAAVVYGMIVVTQKS